jgi:Zn-dependent M32 family carboxypeptidase
VILRYEIERALIDGEMRSRIFRRCGMRKCSTGWDFPPPATTATAVCRIFTGPTAVLAFPSYTLGAMYAAQLMASARRALPQLESDIANGNFSALFDWLRQNIWQHGSRFTTSQLIQHATGEDLNSAISASTLPRVICNHRRRARRRVHRCSSALYIWLHADTKHSRKPRKDRHIVLSTAPQWG